MTVLKVGETYELQSVTGGDGDSSTGGCAWSLIFVPEFGDLPYGTSAGPAPNPEARLALLICDGEVVIRPIWVSPDDVVDLDAIARIEAQRYVQDVLMPVISIGVNPPASGLAGLRSWFWIEGFTGSVTAPPISALGLTIDVRMSSGSVTWDFGDGTTVRGDLGQAYPAESSVQHAYRDADRYTVAARIDLVPEYRVDGGPWVALPNLTTSATATHPVEQRQPVIVDA
ncbi:MAG: hypothetical protein ABWZ76_11715 [Acidimicrobiales bacterium]